MTRRTRLACALAGAAAVLGTPLPSTAHTGDFLVYRTGAGQLGIMYPWTFPTFLDEVLVPYRGDAFNIFVERRVIPNVAIDQYPPFQGGQIYMEVLDSVPKVFFRDGADPQRIIFGPQTFYCGEGGSLWNRDLWIHADQFHPQFDWNAFEWYIDIRVFDAAELHTPSPIYRMRIALDTFCPADFTDTAIPGTPGYGIPNNIVNNDDFFVYLTLFSQGSWRADLTTTAIPGTPGFGDPDGMVTNDDFFYYLQEFINGCRM